MKLWIGTGYVYTSTKSINATLTKVTIVSINIKGEKYESKIWNKTSS